MADKEWIANLKNETTEEIIENLYDFGCDGYYRDLWECLIKEIERRLKENQ